MFYSNQGNKAATKGQTHDFMGKIIFKESNPLTPAIVEANDLISEIIKSDYRFTAILHYLNFYFVVLHVFFLVPLVIMVAW